MNSSKNWILFDSNSIQVFINILRNWNNLSVQLIFNLEKILFIIVCDEIDSETQVAESSRSSYSVQVSLCEFREVKINNNVHWKNVYTSRKNVCAY